MTQIISLDDELIQEARLAGKHKSDTEAVVAALKEYVLRRQQKQIIELFGEIEYEQDYDYKEQRKIR